MAANHFELYSSYIPEGLNLLSLKGFLMANLVLSSFIIFRYFLMVFPFYLIRKNKLKDKVKLKPKQVAFEIKYSLLSTVFFSLSGYFVGLLWDLNLTQIYLKFDAYTLAYLPLSFLIYTLVHEFYFYFTHVWMHKPKVFKKIHSIHHFSNPTSPWASFSFHPLECLVHAVFLPIMVMIIPIHPVVLISYLTFMTVTAIINHLGFELLPFKPINQFFISGTHHGLHHKMYNGNYGLYFCFIDKWMKTEITSRPKESA
jgi:sterol desaturase/sphingolipid hydroxylase (fatty acid hydroxylase superfamily)